MRGRVIVAGALAQHPLGGAGNAWAFLQYVLGFRKLGFDTYYVEHIAADACIDDDWKPAPFAASANARFFRETMRRFELSERAALLQRDGDESVGLDRRAVEALARDTDVFVNLSGRFHLRSVLDAARRRVYVDLDPGFVQIWQVRYGVDMNFDGHDIYVTVGLGLGSADCPLPTAGLPWHPTLPPVVLDEWTNEVTIPPPGSRYTTVADWRGYSPVEWNGQWYGQKSEEFLKIVDVPRRAALPLAALPLEICLAIHPDESDRRTLVEHGWRLADPRVHAADCDSYRDYIRASRGEFTAVKHGYAAGRSGWFSDRSACYLAAGRPVVVQDTGLGQYLPVGAGLLTFTDTDSAVAALRRVESDYERHARAALALAREHLDSDRVLARLLELAAA